MLSGKMPWTYFRIPAIRNQATEMDLGTYNKIDYDCMSYLYLHAIQGNAKCNSNEVCCNSNLCNAI